MEVRNMNCYGIEVTPRRMPELDPGYVPLYQFNHAFLKDARKPLGLAVERSGGRRRWRRPTATTWTGW